MIAGFSFIHRIGVIHGDLKGVNILVDGSNVARLADFGLTTALNNTAGLTSHGFDRGTRGYTAPELLVYADEEECIGEPRAETDVYALGIVMWEVRLLGESGYFDFLTMH